jgi:predicted dehydrogenase
VSEVRVAVVGVGSFGRHHARIYGELADRGVRLVGLVDTDAAAASELAARLGVPRVARVEELPGPIDLVSVAVPTVDHRRVAEPLLARGVHCLVEKPLAGSTRDAEALIEAARRGGAQLHVGLVERYNPVLSALARLGSPPAFVEVHRLAPFGFRASDTGVVMDLMIHDLDLLNRVMGGLPERVEAVGVPVVSGHEDIANARLVWPGGAVANVTASRVSLQRMRRVRIFTRESYLALDFDRREALLVRPGAGLAGAAARAAEGLIAAADLPPFRDLLDIERLPLPEGEPLKEELLAAVTSVREGAPAPVPAEEGLKALRLAERILEALRQHRVEDPAVTRLGAGT